jgi:hypothetical protein
MSENPINESPRDLKPGDSVMTKDRGMLKIKYIYTKEKDRFDALVLFDPQNYKPKVRGGDFQFHTYKLGDPGSDSEYNKQDDSDLLDPEIVAKFRGATMTSGGAGKAVKKLYAKVYRYVDKYDDAALEYLDDNAPMFSQMFEKYEDLDSLVKALDDDTLEKLAGELESVADELKGGVLESINEAEATWPKSDDDESAPQVGDTVMHDKYGMLEVVKISDQDMMGEPAEYIVQTKRGKKRISFDQLVMGESINENPTDQETASGYEAGQARGAAGKSRSLEMGMGGQDVVKTAGGSDVEESLGEDDADNTDRLSVTLDMVAPALKKLHKGYKAEADEYHTAYAEMEADGMSDEEIMNAGDDIIDYVKIDDIEDKIRAIEEVFKEGNYGEVNGNRIIAMASSGDTAMRERFMQELKYAIKDNHPEVYSKLFMYGVGESMDKDQTRMLELAGLPVKEAEEELSKCCDAPIHDGDGDADGRCTSCGEVVRVEEGMDSFVNPMDQDGTDNEKMVDPMADDDVDPEDMTEDDNDYMSADELKRELISDLNHLYDQASTNDFTDNDHILDEMGDYFKDMHANADDVTLDVYKMARDLVDAEPAEVIQFAEKGIQALGGIIEDAEMKDLLRLAGRDNVNEAKSPPEVINPTKDSSPADLKAAIKYAKYMKAKMDTDKAKATYDKEIAQLQGYLKAKSVTKETQDVDTGKQALKAERDPMLTNEALERMLYLVNR